MSYNESIILIKELDNTKKLISMNNIITDNDISSFNINKGSLNQDFYDTYLKVLYVHLVLLLNKSDNNTKINIQDIDNLELFMIYLIFLAIFNLSNLKLITDPNLIKTKKLLKIKYDKFIIKNHILEIIIDKFINSEFNAINLNSLNSDLRLNKFIENFHAYTQIPDNIIDDTNDTIQQPLTSPPTPIRSSEQKRYTEGEDFNYINLISINIINKLILGKQNEIKSFINEFENFKTANIK